MTAIATKHEGNYTARDFASELKPRWCPGCGDYAILAQMKKVLAACNIPPEKTAVISGIGCSSRFPYYVSTYGMHSIHGRAPAIATGLKNVRPDLTTFVITGDGDGLSIGGNHLIHAMRRNVDINIILFNNRVYGLTKGQASPTSNIGMRSPSTPDGSIDAPIKALSLAIACEATFVARTVDVFSDHLGEMLKQAIAHRGVSFLEIYQNCVIFNDGAFEHMTDKKQRADHVLELEHGKPMIYGVDTQKGIRLRGFQPMTVAIGENSITRDDILVHDAKCDEPSLAFLLSRLSHPQFPEPIGVFRDIERPVYGDLLDGQIEDITNKRGEGDLQNLLNGPLKCTWNVN